MWHDVKWSFDFINNDSCEVIDAPAGAALPGCKYIRFYADPDKIIEGNVMIALMDKDKDKILWSWHIWVGAELSVTSNVLNCNLGYTNPLQYSIVGTEARNSALKVEPQQGDATAVEFSVSQPSSGGGSVSDRIWSNTYYQWGRKDPFIGRRSVAERVDGMSFLFSLRPFAGNPFLWDGSIPDLSYNVIGFGYGSGDVAYASKEMNGNLGEQIKNPHKLERSDMVARYDLWNYNNTGNTFATSKDHAVLSQKVGTERRFLHTSFRNS